MRFCWFVIVFRSLNSRLTIDRFRKRNQPKISGECIILCFNKNIVLKHEKRRPITGKIYAFVIVTLRKSLQSASDAYSLLRTPRLAKETLSTRTIEVNTKTPQSILKVQKNCYVANKSAICNISYLIPKH